MIPATMNLDFAISHETLAPGLGLYAPHGEPEGIMPFWQKSAFSAQLCELGIENSITSPFGHSQFDPFIPSFGILKFSQPHKIF